jgi:hypothetical protein
VEALGASGKTDPEQRDVEDDVGDQNGHGELGQLEPLFSKHEGKLWNHDEGEQDQRDDDHRHGDHRHPIGFPIQAAVEREQQLRH